MLMHEHAKTSSKLSYCFLKVIPHQICCVQHVWTSAQRHFTISLVHFNLNNAAFIDELLLLRQNRCSSAKVTFLISGQSKAFALALFSRSFFISDDPSLICFSWNTRTISRTSLCFLEMIGRLYGLSS